VYVPNEASYYKQLDKHVESADEAANMPLVVLGEPGTDETGHNVHFTPHHKYKLISNPL